MYINNILIFISLFFYVATSSQASYVKTSLIIPCHPKHAKYLYDLLKMYEKQTILPDEVVISISEANQINSNIIESLNTEQWAFQVKVLLSNQKLFAGQNRNIACAKATGEIFICQDADDIPHTQRIEIIKYFFEKLKFDFLLHKFVYNDINQINTMKITHDFATIEHTNIHTYHDAWKVGYMLFGQPAIHRKVFEKIQWPAIPIDEDNTFDNKVILTFPNCVMIHVPLYIYRLELSATPYELYRF